MNQRRLVRTCVVDDQRDAEVGGYRMVDEVKEVVELRRAMPATALADHGSGSDIERCKERSRAMRT
jgi:hypothetical protein